MAGPWEKYGGTQAPAAGPWAKYAPQAAPAPQQPVKPAAAPEKPGVAYDMFRSFGTGVREGIEGMIGLPGDVRDIAQQAAGGVRDKLLDIGLPPRLVEGLEQTFMPFGINPLFPTSPNTEDVRGATEAVIGEGYDPQTIPGEYSRTVGQFAPAAVMGPGGLARKTAMAVVPALASETAGQVTKGSEAEPYARLGGALIGGLAAAGRVNPTKIAAKGAPTAEQLKETTDRLYEGLRNAGIRYDANDYARTVQSATDDLLKAGFRPVGVDKTAFEWVEYLSNNVGKSMDFDDINGIVKALGEQARGAARTPDKKSLSTALGIIRDRLMTFEETAAYTSQVPLSGDTFNRIRAGARELAKRNIKNRTLNEVLENADNYTAGQEAGVRNGINNLLRSKRGKQLFNAEEQAALREVAHGRKTLRTLSRFGLDLTKISGNAAFLPTVGALGAGSMLGPVFGGGLLAAGTAAKSLSPYLTNKAFQDTLAAVRSGKLADRTVMNTVRAERIKQNVRRAISGVPALPRPE